MATAIKMPALGESVTEGTVTAWLKNVGDTVEVDEPIVEVATDKVDSEVPSPVAGVLLEVLVSEDDTVEVGTVIAMVGEAGEGSAPVVQEAPQPEATPEPSAPVAETAPAPVVEAPAPSTSTGTLTEIKMPALGESVTEGTVTAWLKNVGDTVEVDEPIVEVATDKVDSEVPSPVAGVLAEVRVGEDDTVAVGEVIAVISTGGAAPAAEAAPEPAPAPAPAPEAASAPAPAAPAPQAAPAAPTRVAPPAPPAAAPTPVPPPPAPAWANSHTEVPADAQAVLDDKATRAAASGRPVAPAVTTNEANVYVTPLVRKLAREQNVDLSTVQGSGVGGRIRKEDVIAAAEAAKAPVVAAPVSAPSAPADSPRGKTEKMSRLRQTVARRMVESLQTAAQLTTVVEVDVTKVAALRARTKDQFLEKYGTKLSFLPFFVKAATEALVLHPKLNAVIGDKEVTYFDYENVGIAVDTERGLMVPVIKNAGSLNIAGIAESINTLAAKAREGKISPDELTGSTFTITNTGSGGALFDTPVLNAPEVGILGVGTIVKRPVVVTDADGKEAIGIHSMVYLSLTYDHRLVDGADAARYLMTVKNRLESADFEADL